VSVIMLNGVQIEIAPERQEEFSPGLNARVARDDSGHRRGRAAQGRRARQGLSQPESDGSRRRRGRGRCRTPANDGGRIELVGHNNLRR
jgi:hypothetical protein